MLYAIAAVLVLIADQWLKYWVTTNIVLDTGSKTLIPGIVSLINIHNDGAAFGMFKGGSMRWVFVVIAMIFVVLVVYVLYKDIIKHPLGRWSAVGVLAGAVGNCIDRVMQGYVVDMFRFDFTDYAIFNVADIFISCCGVLFCIYIIFCKDDGGIKSARKPARSKHSAASAAESRSHVQSSEKAAPARPYSTRSRTQTPVARPQPRPVPQPKPVDPDDPFAEWDKPVANNGEPRFDEMPGGPVEAPFTKTGTASPHMPPSRAPRAYEISSPTAPEREPVKSTPKPQSDEFSLEDILAEFSSND